MSEAMSEAPLPPLFSATLDCEALTQLFFDLGQAAEVFAVLERGARGQVPKEHAATPASLAALAAGLLDGSVSAAQVRYRFAGDEWWDTLTASAAGVRLVRIMHRPLPPVAQAGDGS